MAPESYTPTHEHEEGIYVFSRQSSKPSHAAKQIAVSQSAIHKHPELGTVVTVDISTTGGNSVTIHITMEKLAEWLHKGTPKAPRLGEPPDKLDDVFADISTDISSMIIKED